MLILKQGETCPLSSQCPYSDPQFSGPCQGTLKERKTTFRCSYVVDGKITKGAPRVPGDKTGQMKVILE